MVTAQEYGGSLQGLQPAVHVHDIRNENKEIATLTGTSIGKTLKLTYRCLKRRCIEVGYLCMFMGFSV